MSIPTLLGLSLGELVPQRLRQKEYPVGKQITPRCDENLGKLLLEKGTNYEGWIYGARRNSVGPVGLEPTTGGL